MQLKYNKMETKIDTRNELFKRNEMSFELDSETNPNFEEMKKQVSKEIKKPEENIKVYNIKGNFGSNQFKVDAYVYDSKEDLDNAEQKTQKQRKSEAEDAKKAAEEAAKPAEEKPAEEAPAEEKKEEAPVEDKAEQVEEKPAEAPVEAPSEDKPEEEAKAVKEEKQAEEESKE